MKKAYLFVLCGLLILTIAGCGTIKGLGDDIGTVGKWLTKGSNSVTKDTNPKK